MDREQFLAARMDGIGGSDAAAALGLSSFKTTFELWLEKTGQLPAVDLDDVERIRFGKLMEAPIADEYEHRNNVKLRRRNQILRNPAYPWMLANIDRQIEGQRCGLEIKNVDGMAYRMGDWGEPGSDEIPEPYLLQCLHYLVVTGFDEWRLAACIGGNRLETFVIHRDHELEEMLIDGEHEFWQRVQTRQAPEPDYAHETTVKVLKRLYPGTDGSEIQFGPDIEQWHTVKQQADALAKRYSDVSEGAKNHLLIAMGEAAIARLPDGSAYRRKLITRKAYSVEEASYMDMRHVKGAKEPS
jgi:putative phage-type endonuclease